MIQTKRPVKASLYWPLSLFRIILISLIFTTTSSNLYSKNNRSICIFNQLMDLGRLKIDTADIDSLLSSVQHEGIKNLIKLTATNDPALALRQLSRYRDHQAILDQPLKGGVSIRSILNSDEERIEHFLMHTIESPVQAMDDLSSESAKNRLLLKMADDIPEEGLRKTCTDYINSGEHELAINIIQNTYSMFDHSIPALFNKVGFRYKTRELYKIAEKGQMKGKKIYVVYFDYGDLNVVNRFFGHNGPDLSGDSALSNFVELVKKNMRRTDFLSRQGGDEFAMAITAKDSDDAKKFIERILKNYHDSDFLKRLNSEITEKAKGDPELKRFIGGYLGGGKPKKKLPGTPNENYHFGRAHYGISEIDSKVINNNSNLSTEEIDGIFDQASEKAAREMNQAKSVYKKKFQITK